MDKLEIWESLIDQFESEAQPEKVSMYLLCSILANRAPMAIKDHHILTAESGANYQDIQKKIEKYVNRNKVRTVSEGISSLTLGSMQSVQLAP